MVSRSAGYFPTAADFFKDFFDFSFPDVPKPLFKDPDIYVYTICMFCIIYDLFDLILYFFFRPFWGI